MSETLINLAVKDLVVIKPPWKFGDEHNEGFIYWLISQKLRGRKVFLAVHQGNIFATRVNVTSMIFENNISIEKADLNSATVTVVSSDGVCQQRLGVWRTNETPRVGMW